MNHVKNFCPPDEKDNKGAVKQMILLNNDKYNIAKSHTL
jgi:hypothetical protein